MKKYLSLAVALAFIAIAGSMVTPLYKAQIREDLTSEPVKGVSPDLVLLTTALGAFRGIVINVIWIRMEGMKAEGKFFEIAQLAELACKLAPRFPKVWDFNAWNMAYNISVQIPDHRDRWPWVRRGIELLRDQGIPNNPEEPELYFSLAWIYKHKIGDHSDDAHFWYKQRLGLKMHEVLGGRGSREALQELANAPQSRDTLFQDRDLRAFYQRLVRNGFDPLRSTAAGQSELLSYLRNPESVPESARVIAQSRENRELMRQIELYVRARTLRNQLKMIPGVMLELMDEYGPLDWRNPYSHAIYWATLGRRVAAAYRDRTILRRMQREGMSTEEILMADSLQFDESRQWLSHRYRDLDYDRVIYSSLQNMVTRGRLLFDTSGRLMPMMGPDYRFTESMLDQFELMLERYSITDPHMRGIENAYEHFLARITTEFFYMGSTSDSRRYYEMLQERFPKGRYEVSHEEFVTQELREFTDLASPSAIRSLIRGLLYQSYMNLAADADDRADALYGRARRLANIWNERHELTGDEEDTLRWIADFSSIRETVLIDIFAGRAGMSDELVGNLGQRLPSDLVDRVKKAAETAEKDGDILPFDDDMLRMIQ